MVVKDRLAELQAKNAKAMETKAKRKETNGTPLLSSEQRLTDCLAVVTQIDNKIKKMKDEVEQMIKLQKNILSNPMVDKKEVKQLEQTADKIFNTSSQIQKEVSAYRAEVRDMHLDDNHERVIMTHLDRLNGDVSRTMNEFRAAQLQYIEKTQKLHNKKVEIVGGDAAGASLSDPSSSQAVFGADFLMEAQKAKMELRELEIRDMEIKKIENSVIEVNRLFKEINALIMEQGETLDTIEKHVEQSVSKVEDGNVQLVQARKHQQAARRKKICCIGILVAVLVIAGVVVTIIIVNNSSNNGN